MYQSGIFILLAIKFYFEMIKCPRSGVRWRIYLLAKYNLLLLKLFLASSALNWDFAYALEAACLVLYKSL